MNALILVGLQNDFLPGGAVPVPHGNAVIPLANQLQGAFKLVVATQEWHPANHMSFASVHSGRKPGEVFQFKNQTQRLWPTHCVQNTRGAELAAGLMLNRVNKVFRAGMDAEVDGYSAFFDAGLDRPTGLHSHLKEKNATDLYLMGLATEGCVRATALDALSLEFSVILIEDACRGLNVQPEDSGRAIDEMKSAGVAVIHSRELLEIPKRG
jgi:nicotinamidase/pyrazinamidase